MVTLKHGLLTLANLAEDGLAAWTTFRGARAPKEELEVTFGASEGGLQGRILIQQLIHYQTVELILANFHY